MKYSYDSMSIDDICDVYDKMFSPPFIVDWGDKLSNHRQEIIDCIEFGVPQDPNKARSRNRFEGVPGIDFVY